MFKLLFLVVVMGGLFFSNPPLKGFSELLKQRISDDQSSMRAGAGFIRDITGITRLKQGTGSSANYVCRKDLYVGSLYLYKHSSVTTSNEPLALGAGIAGQVFLKKLDDSSQGGVLSQAIGALNFTECEDFLAG